LGCLLPSLLRVAQPLRHLLVAKVRYPAFSGTAPTKIADRHVDSAVDEELHAFVVLAPHELVQDAGGLMGAPFRVDVSAVVQKKVGDLEVVVHNSPSERGVEHLLRIGLTAEPNSEIAAVMGV